MPAPTALIAQISDLHIKPPGHSAYGVVNTAEALQRCVAHLNRLDPRPDMVVISGDLTDSGGADEYAHLMQLIAPLGLPYCAVPGNHDDRGNFRRALAAQPYARLDGPLDLRIALGGLDLILLDSSVPGAPHGTLAADTLAFLATSLAAAPDRPAMIFLHHPPFATGIAHMDRQNLRNADALADILRRHPRARLVAAGHVHRATMTLFAGVPATICPAINHAVDLNLGEAGVPALRIEPPSLYLHTWFAGKGFGDIVTHAVPIGEFDGPFPFCAPDGRPL